jgi:hypothetical protein
MLRLPEGEVLEGGNVELSKVESERSPNFHLGSLLLWSNEDRSFGACVGIVDQRFYVDNELARQN